MEKTIQALVLDVDGVLTDGRVMIAGDGQEMKCLSYRDIDAVFQARREGLKVAIITGENSPWIDSLIERLELDGAIKGAKDKGAAIQKMSVVLGIPVRAMCYVGDSERDIPAIQASGLGLVPADGAPQAQAAADLVLRSRGGFGAVEEALKQCLQFNETSPKDAAS